MKPFEYVLRVVMVAAAGAFCIGVGWANPVQPAGCNSLCKQVNEYHDCVIYGRFRLTDCQPCDNSGSTMCVDGLQKTCKLDPNGPAQFVRRGTTGTPLCNCVAGSVFWVEASNIGGWIDPEEQPANRKVMLCVTPTSGD